MDIDSFEANILGVTDLVSSDTNKVKSDGSVSEEGAVGEYIDVLHLPMEDSELLKLKEEWEGKHNSYYPKIEPRQKINKLYYKGHQRSSRGDTQKTVSSNLIFESEETFIPQALSKNPEPVVWSDNTDEGKAASNDLKTMHQYHADVLCLRKKLGVMVRHWSVYFIGILKHGWSEELNDISLELRKPTNFVLDPNGYIDEFGDYKGDFLGERIECTAEKLIEMYPKSKEYIATKVENKMGTNCVRTEWWTNEYCFTTFQDEVLDKHKNEFFNYEDSTTDTATPGINHFAVPKMPYTFLSVFSFQEEPYDVTNLIEQNVANQDRINDRDDQISKNLRNGNNSIALSGISFNSETARQAASALEDGDPVLVPDGQVENAIKRLPAPGIPDAVFKAQQNDKDTLRGVFGIQGLVADTEGPPQTARGMILNQSHDSSRIGGGIGDALEQVADNVFNWWTQLYCVFYDEPHYGAVMGNGRAVEYVTLLNTHFKRKFVVSVSPNSMTPKDEITEQNLAIELWGAKAIDPINLFKRLNDPDPMNTAKMVTMWNTNPQLYMQTFFPEAQPAQATPQPGQAPPIPGSPPENPSEPPASPALSQVPISTNALPK